MVTSWRVLITDYAWADLDIERAVLEEIGAELVVASESDPATLCELASDVDAIMTCWAGIPRQVIEAAPRCRVVSRMGIGLDNIDVASCSEHGIPVTNVPDYCATEVAEHALALLFALARNVGWFHQQTKAGIYQLSAAPVMQTIEGQTLGIIGLGSSGCRLANKAAALGLRVLGVRRSETEVPGVRLTNLEMLLNESDFISLHVPLYEATRHLIGKSQLERMKNTAFLINTSRGGLVDHDALAKALETQEIAGAALDVQDPEPPDLNQPPFNHARVIVTPHAAFASSRSVAELRRRATEHVAQCLQGELRLQGELPAHVVNRAALG